MTSPNHATAMGDLWQAITDASPRNGDRGWNRFAAWEAERGRRDPFLERFGFAVPTLTAIKAIRRFVGQRKVLEVGAGTGIWSRLLSDEGITITAVDDGSGEGRYSHPYKVGAYYPVELADGVEAVKRYRAHKALFLCWPDYESPMAADALNEFRGDRLVYIGEDAEGCAGDDRFHDMLARWRLVKSIAIPQWPGIHDEVVLYERLP